MISLYSLPIQLTNFKKYFFGNKLFEVYISNTKFIIRPRSYDPYVISETFVEQVYKPKYKFRNINNVIDLGAYTGDFSIWATKHLKAKKVISVEMDINNYNLLKENIEINNLSRKIIPINEAISNKIGKIKVLRNGFNHGMHRISENGDVIAKTSTLKNIIERSKMMIVDLIKMDIEGAEKQVLNEENKKIFSEKVKMLIMESHPKYMKNIEVLEYFKSIGFKINVRKQWLRMGNIIEVSNSLLL